MLTGYIKHKTNLTIAEEQVGVAIKNIFSRNAESRRQSTSRAVNPITYRDDYFGHKRHIDQIEKLGMYGVTHVAAIDGHSHM